jgi:hypothetical protein
MPAAAAVHAKSIGILKRSREMVVSQITQTEHNLAYLRGALAMVDADLVGLKTYACLVRLG